MRAFRSLGLRAAAAVAAAALMLVAPACGYRQSQEQVPKPQQSERIAGSMQDFAKLLLEQNGGEMGDVQKSAVKKAATSGKVTAADYETGVSGYRQCMLDLGYKEIIFIDIGRGLKVEATHKTGTDEQEKKYIDDSSDCNSRHMQSVGALYEKQIGNPSLIKDHYEAVAECLKKEKLVDPSYDGRQYKAESEKYMDLIGENNKTEWPYSFDKDKKAEVNICKFTNGELDVDPDWPWEYIY
ncbi:hypothetical protein [Bifidobacterium jacchi]|uniref:Lipoprotein n=1 Tax=Bifidobacterium jacchi TaxID=2490545 RepID=A0A5N5RKV7_9BIFI|nr:hypothetical protein [Bifidobacterium jacchi]KAB5607955.1 hypothetical protein EHS19_03250 [Bifidobacterium jacchi]